MKISLLWLKEFVDVDLPAEEVVKVLRGLGFDTASVTTVGAGVANVVAAKVEAREKHPNADKLSLCQVFDGTTRFRVVCGAPNVAAGQTVPLARMGATLPGGLEIKPAKIRGEDSQGMLCSTRELGLGEDAGGILVLPEDTPLGEDINKTLFLNDAVLDVEIMPHRPDLLSHWGVARELAAALRKPLKMPETSVPSAPPSLLAVVEEKVLCPRYIARAVEGVAVKPSPLWMRLRLERCGIRSINNLVDVTNYVMLEFGHPLHVFDREALSGGKVTVRTGRAGESLACLDGETRSVEGVLVIADDAKPQAVAGVMGGSSSGVTEKTKNLLLESAYFQPSQVRAARRRLNVSTESSYRFERGTDRSMAALASARAANLLVHLTGGKIAAEQDVQGAPVPAVSVRVSPARIESLLGFPVSMADVRDTLVRLSFGVQEEGADILATPPLHRHDIKETSDVAEELGRLTGLDKVPTRVKAASQKLESPSREKKLLLSGREALMGFGFTEARNYGLLSRASWESFTGAPAADAVELDNPLSLSGDLLAPSLLPTLLANLQLNRRRGAANGRLFETAKTFRDAEGTVQEGLQLSFAAMGALHDDHWSFKPRPLSVWDMKSWVKSLLKGWRVPGVAFKAEALPAFLHPAQAQTVLLGGKPAGCFGRLHPRRADSMDLPRDTFVAELDLTLLAAVDPLGVKHESLAQHPSLIRDFSLVFPESVSWSSVALHVVKNAEWAEDVQLFDVYKGDGLPSGHRSLAFRVAFRHPDRTLTDAEAAKVQEKLLAGLLSEFKGSLRA
jgi:phenylalanyl-tRNA synthetase beta chain